MVSAVCSRCAVRPELDCRRASAGRVHTADVLPELVRRTVVMTADQERLYGLMCRVKLVELTPAEASAMCAILAPAVERVERRAPVVSIVRP